jgi:hypothetical protein
MDVNASYTPICDPGEIQRVECMLSLSHNHDKCWVREGGGKSELLSLDGAKKSRKSIAGKICDLRQSGWSIGAEPWLNEA